jgi:hypothetical protein
MEGVDLSTLFANLDNNYLPQIFQNKGKNKASIEKYNRKV